MSSRDAFDEKLAKELRRYNNIMRCLERHIRSHTNCKCLYEIGKDMELEEAISH